MVHLFIVKKNNKIIRFYGKGHANFAKKGHDVVCAAISALTQHTVFGIVDYLKIDAEVHIKDGFLDLNLGKTNITEKQREKADVLLETLVLTLKNIETEYSKNFKLFEEEA